MLKMVLNHFFILLASKRENNENQGQREVDIISLPSNKSKRLEVVFIDVISLQSLLAFTVVPQENKWNNSVAHQIEEVDPTIHV